MIDNAPERFRSHKNYVEALAWVGGRPLLTSNRDSLSELTNASKAAPISDKRPPRIDYDQVHRSLRNAWSTELLLSMPSQWTEEDEFIRLTNTWGVIQAYYVGYHATQALIVARGYSRPTAHPKTQQLYVDLWVDRPLNFPPWTFGVGMAGFKNVPQGVTISPVHSWESCSRSNAWDLAAKVIKSTRDDALKRALSAKRDEKRATRKRTWEEEERQRIAGGGRARKKPAEFSRPRLSDQEKATCDQRLRTYSLLDYLWRLRVNSNYDDAGVFMEGPQNDTDSFNVHTRMAYLAAGLALLSEARICSLVGKARFQRWADDFIAKSIPDPYAIGIKLRRGLS